MRKEPDLMFCCLGNGITVCDRTREECGDYKTVAHIDSCGAIRLYDGKLTAQALTRINEQAAAQARNFKHGFIHLPRAAALDMLNDILNVSQFLTVFHEEMITGKPMEEIYQTYVKYVCLNGRRNMPKQQSPA